MMANCFAWLKGRNKPVRSIKLIIVGLDDAGKTTTIACLQGEPPDGITPTIGFSNATLTIGKWNITLYDLGGGSSVRSVWEKYYAEVYGIIFTVDSVNVDKIVEANEVLSSMFKNPLISGKPIAVFANKQDKDGALTEKEITEKLELQKLSEKHKFNFSVFPCSALKGYGKKMDRSIKQGLEWLLSAINNDYSTIHVKVDKESAIQNEIEAKERKERIERIKKLREEREKAAIEAGVQEEAEESEDDVVTGNPFRNINDQIGVTEKREKKEKEKAKKIKAYQEQQKRENEDDFEEPRSKKKKSKKREKKSKEVEEVEEESEDNEEDKVPVITVQSPTPRGHSLEHSGNRKKKKKGSPYKQNDHAEENKPVRRKVKKKQSSRNPLDDEDEVHEQFEGIDISKQKKNVNKQRTSSENVHKYDEHTPNIPHQKAKKRTKYHSEGDYIDDVSDNENFDRNIDRDLQHRKQIKNRLREEFSDEDEILEPIKIEQYSNNARTELFRAKSYDSFQGSTSLRTNKKNGNKKKKKKKKIIYIEENDDIDEEYIEQNFTKRKKKKPKSTSIVPTSNSPPLNDPLSYSKNHRNLPPLSNGTDPVSKLQPIKLRGRLPDIGKIESSSIPSWARAQPSYSDKNIIT